MPASCAEGAVPAAGRVGGEPAGRRAAPLAGRVARRRPRLVAATTPCSARPEGGLPTSTPPAGPVTRHAGGRRRSRQGRTPGAGRPGWHQRPRAAGAGNALAERCARRPVPPWPSRRPTRVGPAGHLRTRRARRLRASRWPARRSVPWQPHPAARVTRGHARRTDGSRAAPRSGSNPGRAGSSPRSKMLPFYGTRDVDVETLGAQE